MPTVFTTTNCLSLFSARPIHFTPSRTIFLTYTTTLSSHLRLGPSSKSFTLRFTHQNPLYISPLQLRATYPIQFTILCLTTRIIFSEYCVSLGNRGSTVVKVLCYKSEGRWFDPSRCHWNFSLILNPSDRIMTLGSTQPLTEMSTRIISWG